MLFFVEIAAPLSSRTCALFIPKGTVHAKRAVVLDAPSNVNSSLRDEKGAAFFEMRREGHGGAKLF